MRHSRDAFLPEEIGMISRVLRAVIVLAALTQGVANAQGLLGSILGSVTDAKGATVGDVTVTAVSRSTNLQVNATTQANGLYQIPNLPIGIYSVSFKKAGFDVETHPQIVVQAERASTVNASLKVGAVSTTVEVQGTPLLNETDATNGYVLDSNTISQTPLATGSFTQLALLSPGVNADFISGSGSNAGLGNQDIWANGQRDTSNSFVINGVNSDNLFNGKTGSSVASSRYILNTGQGSTVGGQTTTNVSVYDAIGQALPSPPQETLEEIRVNTAMYDATQGARSGAHISAITKSGTNAYHGEIYEYFQNTIFNAAPFFRNAAAVSTAILPGQRVPPLHYNRPGATFGGPIKKDKLFFFGSYQALRVTDNLAGSSTATVPQHLSDDRSAAALVNVAQQDLGVTIAQSQIDPSALKILNLKVNGSYFIPSANITNAASAKQLGYNVLVNGASSTSSADIGTGSVDYNWNDKERFSAKLLYQDSPNYNPFGGGTAVQGFGKRLDSGSELASIDNTSILKPNLTWENKVGFVRMRSYANTQQPFTPSDAGINLWGIPTFPQIALGITDNNINKSLSFGPSGNFANVGLAQNKWDVSSTASWVHGRHTLSFGVSWNHTQLNIINNITNAASIGFTNFGQFLTGTLLPSSTSFYNGSANRYYRADQIGTYAQDSYKLKSNLTLSLGFRYDYDGPLTEKYGKLVNFDSTAYAYNAANDTITNSGFVFAGNSQYATPGTSNSTLKNLQQGFGPRVGMAWSPSFVKHFTIRGGFGLYYDRGELFTYFSPGAGGGYSGPFGVTDQLPFTVQIAPPTGATLSAPFGPTPPGTPGDPSILAKQLPNIAQLTAGSAPYIFGGYDAHNNLPYTTNWSFDIQYQPINSVVLTLGYVGNHGANQVLPVPFNQGQIATASNPVHGQTSSYGFNILPSETIATREGGNSSIRAPYLGFSTNSVLYQTIGTSNYNALQFSVKKSLSHGLQGTLSYTWSHALDIQSGLGLFYNGNNPLKPSDSYATSTFDRTHVLTSTYSYEIPGVKTKSGLLPILVNGWTLNGLVSLQSGQPYNFIDFSGAVAGVYNSTTVNISDPILGFTPGSTISQLQLQGTTGINVNKPLVDTSKLYIPVVAPGTYGVPACEGTVCDTYETSFSGFGRNTFRGPFQSRVDMSLAKQTRFAERYLLNLRFDVFNVANHPDFDTPNVNVSLYTANKTGNAIKSITVKAISSSLGLVQNTLGSPRIMMLSAHFRF
jgi:hypothetical protein